MERLNLPPANLKIAKDKGRLQVFDIIRKKYVALTPEEWVRQHFLHYFISGLNYPPGLIAVEKVVKINGMNKRADIVVYDKKGTPAMIVECKAPDVAVDNSVFEQAAGYNLRLGVDYLLITNGMKHYCAKLDKQNQGYVLLGSIPQYRDLND
ncbi:MAG: type I restriction enzyme HsdR N-terminal domain-containing protein [Chlorobi bacterium]|nr:type I restriction enzyme HsdR N-terminal domain-containing protein [Chlorobiota bacterium]